MKIKSLLKSLLGLCIVTIITLSAFNSCEVGLGSAVDTEAPVIDFAEDTVGSGAVIRDSFMVRGIWSDDGTIDYLKATLTNTSGKTLSVDVTGTVETQSEGKGTWNVVFDPLTSNIPDGSYELTINIADKGKHVSKITRAFVIDNTAPLVVLSRPSTKLNSLKIDSYGQSFTLEGKAADDNDVSLIEVKVYADAACQGTPLKTIQLPNVPLTIEQDVAVYDKTKANDYAAIYGHVDANGIAIKDGTKAERYCTLVVYDGAQRYPSDGSAQTDADKLGNSVNYYYLNSDVSKLFTAGYKITELYHILNGSYEQGNASRSISQSDVRDLLANPGNQTTCGKFSINPENSPSFVVSSRNTLVDGHELAEYPITNGNSQIEVEITPGLDGHLIVEDSVGIYLVKCDKYGNPLKADDSPAANESEAEIVWLIEKDKHDIQGDITQSGSTYKFKTKEKVGNNSYPDLVVGKNYYISVTGKDEQGNSIVSDGIYGFQLISSGKNIEVGIKSEPEWLSTKPAANDVNKKVKITLTYPIDNKPFDVYRQFNGDVPASGATPLENGTNIITSPFVDTITDLSSEPDSVTYKLTGNDSAESNQKTISLKYDDTVPSVPTITTWPDVNATEQDSITFKGAASDADSGIEDVYVQFWDSTNIGTKTAEIKASYSGGSWFYQTSPKTDNDIKTVFASEGKKVIKVIAVDKVGLKNTAQKEFTYDTSKPDITITKSQLEGASETASIPSIVNKRITLIGTTSDVYGINKIEIEQSKNGGTPVKKTLTAASSWTTVDLPYKSDGSAYTVDDTTNDIANNSAGADGTYTYKITVTDDAGKTNSVTATIILKTVAPEITVSTPAFNANGISTKWQTSKNVTVSGTATSSANITGVYYIINKKTTDTAPTTTPTNPKDEASWEAAGWTAASGTNSWSINLENLSESSSANKLYISAADEANNATTIITRTIRVDATAPTLEPLLYQLGDSMTPAAAEGQIYAGGDKNLIIYGKVSDTVSGVSSLSFKLKDNTITPTIKYSLTENPSEGQTVADLTYDKDLSGNQSKVRYWKATIDKTLIDSKDECGDLIVTSKNGAGISTSDVKIFTISYDDKVPAISNISIDSTTKKHYKESETVYWVNQGTTASPNKITISGVATDNFGIKEVALYFGDTKKGTITENPSEWSFTDLNLSSYAETATIAAKVIATDVSEKTFEKTFTIKFDKTSPVSKHQNDEKGKDIYFRIGDQDNDDITTSSTNPAWNNDKDRDVGGKYKDGTYGDANTIKIRGYFEDGSGSGLKRLYYKVFQIPTTLPSGITTADAYITSVRTSFESNYETEKTGLISPLETPEVRRVFYKGNVLSGGTALGTTGKYYQDITSHYKETLSGFKVGNNYVLILAVDNVGNVTFEDTTYKLNYDDTAPTITEKTTGDFNKTYIVNDQGKDSSGNALKIEGKVKDDRAGLRSFTIKVNETVLDAANIKYDTNKTELPKDTSVHTWTATIPADVLNAQTGAIAIYAETVDDAGTGHSVSRKVGSVQIDTTAPSMRVTSTAGWIKNSITNASVYVNDINGIKNNQVSYNVYLSTDTSYANSLENGTATVGDDGVATVASINTSNTTNFATGKSYIIRFTAEDIVGNKQEENSGAYKVDRTVPTWSSTTINDEPSTNLANLWFKSSQLTIAGAFTDKAGSITGSGVKTIRYKLNSGSEQTTPTTDGSYSFNLDGFDDGENTLELRATDDMSNTGGQKSFTVKVDTSKPEISAINTNDFTLITLTNGSAAKTFEFYVTDTGSGVAPAASSVEVKAGTRTITSGSNGSSFAVAAVEGQTNKWKVTVTLGVTDLNALSGNNSVLVSVSDKAGNSSLSTSIGTLNVDKDKPAPSFTSHAASAVVNKSITLGGKVTDASNSEITAINLTATCGSVTKNYAYPSGTDGNISYSNGQWSLPVDTTEFNNTTSAKNLVLSLKATDKAGNQTATAVQLTLSIDQNTDRPIVKFTNLEKDTSGNYILKYGTNARLEGSVSDDDATSESSVIAFLASSDPITETTGWTESPTGTWTHSSYGTTTFNKATGDFTYTPKDTADGEKTVYFYVKDNNNAIFYAGKTSQLERPYQQFKTDAKADHSNAISYKSDSESPVINSSLIQAYTGATGDNANGTAVALGESCAVGGRTKNYADITVSAKDSNGIQKIEVKVGDTTYSSAVTNDGTVTNPDSNGNYVFKTNRINISSVAEGTVSVSIKVYDNSGLYSNQETSFFVDRTAPTITISTPSSDGVTYYGTIKQNIASGITTGGDSTRVYFTVSEDGTLTDFEGTDITSSVGVTASLVFDGNLSSTENGYHTKTLHDWIADLKAGDTTYNIDENDANVPLYIYYKAVDPCGNFSVEKRLINVIPNGDKPTVYISYPENKKDPSTNLMTKIPALAGTIRLYGTTEIQAYSVDSVYIQIAANYTNNYNWDNWQTDFATVEGTSQFTIVDIPFSGTKQANGTYTNNKKGIKASGTPDNWNLPINGDAIFESDATRHMAIRVFAVSDSGTDAQGNKKGKVSEPEIQAFDIDKTAPRIGGDDSSTNRYSLQLVQFEEGHIGDLNKIVSKAAYKSDMWVTGNWYLLTSVFDDNGIKTITLDEHKNAGIKSLVAGNAAQSIQTVESKDCYVTTADTGNFNIVIPLPTGTANSSGSITYTIEATENTDFNLSSVETIQINYDNTPPKISTSNYTLELEKMISSPKVYDEDGFYKLKGFVTDAGGNASGLFGVAFYFVRRGSQNCVYDPMYYRKNSVSITSAKDATAANLANNDIVYANGLYWKHKELEDRSDSLTEIKLSAADVNIHKGGLVMLGGKIYKIKNLSNDGKTITLNDSAPKTITTADFALAMLVDNRNGESQDIRTQDFTSQNNYAYGYCTTINDDDGDHMLEKLGGDTEGRWEASIYSKNIPDGPIEIHYVAFDKAQNYTVGIIGNIEESAYKALTTNDAVEAVTLSGKASEADDLSSYYQYFYDANNKGRVSNNAPRIASVTVGTDYNGNTTIEDFEKRTEYFGGFTTAGGTKKARDITDSWILSTTGDSTGNAKFVIKDKTSVGFEIIGGNNNLYYQYSIDTTYKEHSAITSWTRDNKQGGGYNPMTVHGVTEGKASNEDGIVYYNASSVDPIIFELSTIEEKVPNNNNNKVWWTIELWDETQDTTVFTDSQYAQLKLPLNVQIYDTTAPNTVISPLYWNSATDNSVYKDVNDKLYGHVELKSELGTSTLGTTYGTGDDKVSGIVVFKGFAYDNKRLSTLKWAVVDHAANNTYTNPTYLFPATNGALQNGATFSNGSWTGSGTLNTDHYTFQVSDAADDGAYLDEKGHKVAWTLTLDTSYIKNIVESDARIYVYAQDAATPTAKTTSITNTEDISSSTDQQTYDAETSKPTYQIDILPYITEVITRLASKDLPSRTALGHYPIATDEEITLKGYNLKAGSADITIANSVIAGMSSNSYEYTVRGTIKTINNLNNNDAHGSFDITVEGLGLAKKTANMYNRQPDTNTNLNLTDDVYFDMWDLNNDAATSGYPALKYPVMHINPANNQIGFGFVRGTDSVSFPANGNSYVWYQTNRKDYVNTNFVYDNKGVAHTISIGLDAQFDTGIAGRMNYNNSTWYDATNNHGATNVIKQWDKDYNIALESIGIPNGVYVKGTQTAVSGGQGSIDIERFSIPSMAVATHGNNSAVYIIYYDTNHDQIRFRYGLVPNNGTARGSTNNALNNYGLLNDSKSEQQRCTSVDQTNANTQTIPSDTTSDNHTYNSHGMFEADREYYSLVTGKYYKQAHDTNANEGIPNNTAAGTMVYDTGNNGSEIHAIGVVPSTSTTSMNDDKVVMVWYDKTVNKLKYMYRTNLGTNADALDRTKAKRDADSDGVSNGTTVYWSAPKDLFGTNKIPVSKIALTVDKNGGIHIAAYDQNNADLVYAYLPTYNHLDTANNTAYICRVDAYSQIGTDLTIDTAIVNNKVVPYISYYAEGLAGTPKMAYLVGGIDTTSATTISNSVADGADKDSKLFTGKWEVTIIPTLSQLQRYDVSIGLFKNTNGNGTLITPTAGTDTATSKDERKRYANGSTDLVVGYSIKNNGVGYIETAMRKGVPDKIQH